MSKNTGGPAFPSAESFDRFKQAHIPANQGMTLRDYFAAKALPPILAQDDYGVLAHAATSKNTDHGTWAAYWAAEAYAIADAMLAERVK